MARLYGVGNGIHKPCGIGNHPSFAVSQRTDTFGCLVQCRNLRVTGGHDVIPRFCHNVDAGVPINGHILDELEGVHIGLVMLREVGCHLQRRVEGNVKSQLVADGVMHLLSPRHDFAHVGFENAGGVVHRAALQTGERQDGGVSRMDALAELGAHRTLVANHVGPSAIQTSGTYRLVRVDHNVVLGGLHDSVMIVIIDRLAVVALAKRDDGAHITALHGIVSVLVHQRVSLLHPMLVVDSGSAALVVHDEADALFVGVFVQCGQVEIGIRCKEVEDELLLFTVPVFPTDIPALDEQSIETIGSGKVDITAHIGIVGTVGAVRSGVNVVGLTELHRREVVGVAPSALAGNHLPPHTHVLHGVDPGDILQSAWFVEVENEAGSEYIGGLLAHHDGAPRGMARGLDTAFVASSIRTQPRTEGVFWLLAIGF